MSRRQESYVVFEKTDETNYRALTMEIFRGISTVGKPVRVLDPDLDVVHTPGSAKSKLNPDCLALPANKLTRDWFEIFARDKPYLSDACLRNRFDVPPYIVEVARRFGDKFRLYEAALKGKFTDWLKDNYKSTVNNENPGCNYFTNGRYYSPKVNEK